MLLLVLGVEVLEVLLLFLGFYAGLRGKIALRKNLATEGTPARCVGLIFILLMPLTIACRYALAEALKPAPGRMSFDPGAKAFAELLDGLVILAVFTVGLVAACGIVFAFRTSGPDAAPEPSRRRGSAPPAEPPPFVEELPPTVALPAARQAQPQVEPFPPTDITARPRLEMPASWEVPARATPAVEPASSPRQSPSQTPLTPGVKLAIVCAGVALLFGMVAVVAVVQNRPSQPRVQGAPTGPAVAKAEHPNRNEADDPPPQMPAPPDPFREMEKKALADLPPRVDAPPKPAPPLPKPVPPPPEPKREHVIKVAVVSVEGFWDAKQWEAIRPKVQALADSDMGGMAVTDAGNTKWVELWPVKNIDACAKKVTFGTIGGRYGDGFLIHVAPSAKK